MLQRTVCGFGFSTDYFALGFCDLSDEPSMEQTLSPSLTAGLSEEPDHTPSSVFSSPPPPPPLPQFSLPPCFPPVQHGSASRDDPTPAVGKQHSGVHKMSGSHCSESRGVSDVPNMLDVLKDMNKVKLRPIERYVTNIWGRNWNSINCFKRNCLRVGVCLLLLTSCGHPLGDNHF